MGNQCQNMEMKTWKEGEITFDAGDHNSDNGSYYAGLHDHRKGISGRARAMCEDEE